MSNIDAITLIPATPERVFDVVSSFGWLGDVSRVVPLSGPVGLGANFATETRWMGRRFEIVMMVDGYCHPSSLSVVSVGARQFAFRGSYTISRQDSLTRVHLRMTVVARGWWKLFSRIAHRAAADKAAEAVARLNEAVSSPVTA